MTSTLQDFDTHICVPHSKFYIPEERRCIWDMTHGYGDERHHMCYRCNSHLWKGKIYNKEEWETYVNQKE